MSPGATRLSPNTLCFPFAHRRPLVAKGVSLRNDELEKTGTFIWVELSGLRKQFELGNEPAGRSADPAKGRDWWPCPH